MHKLIQRIGFFKIISNQITAYLYPVAYYGIVHTIQSLFQLF